MSPKELKKLAKACREAGIKHYKCAEMEFTLTDELPLSNYKKRLTNKISTPFTATDLDEFGDTELTDEQKLFYSSQSLTTEESNS